MYTDAPCFLCAALVPVLLLVLVDGLGSEFFCVSADHPVIHSMSALLLLLPLPELCLPENQHRGGLLEQD